MDNVDTPKKLYPDPTIAYRRDYIAHSLEYASSKTGAEN